MLLLPDPVMRRSYAPLEAWVERGHAPEAAAAVIARATAGDVATREAAYARALAAAHGASTRRQREQLVRSFLPKTPPGA